MHDFLGRVPGMYDSLRDPCDRRIAIDIRCCAEFEALNPCVLLLSPLSRRAMLTHGCHSNMIIQRCQLMHALLGSIVRSRERSPAATITNPEFDPPPEPAHQTAVTFAAPRGSNPIFTVHGAVDH